MRLSDIKETANSAADGIVIFFFRHICHKQYDKSVIAQSDRAECPGVPIAAQYSRLPPAIQCRSYEEPSSSGAGWYFLAYELLCADFIAVANGEGAECTLTNQGEAPRLRTFPSGHGPEGPLGRGTHLCPESA